MYVNGDPVNLVDPNGHGACAGNSTGSCQPAHASAAQTMAADWSAQNELSTYRDHWVQSGTPFAHLDNNTDQCIQGCGPRTLLFAGMLNLGLSKTMFGYANYKQTFVYDAQRGAFVCSCDGTQVAYDGTGFVRLDQPGASAGILFSGSVPSTGNALVKQETQINSVLSAAYLLAMSGGGGQNIYTGGGNVNPEGLGGSGGEGLVTVGR